MIIIIVRRSKRNNRRKKHEASKAHVQEPFKKLKLYVSVFFILAKLIMTCEYYIYFQHSKNRTTPPIIMMLCPQKTVVAVVVKMSRIVHNKKN